jgi:sulfatase modifying factor 1
VEGAADDGSINRDPNDSGGVGAFVGDSGGDLIDCGPCTGDGGGQDAAVDADGAPPAPTFTVGGTVNGLQPGFGLVLQNHTDYLLVSGVSGPFTFRSALPTGSPYAVTVETSGETCTVSNGSGTVVDSNVTTIVVTCTLPSDGAAPPPSCAPGGPGMTNCGAYSESCCASLEVSGGSYYRTYTNNGSGPTGEADPATISYFYLDNYLVTVGRFRQFVAAWNNGWLPPPGSGKHTHVNGGEGLVNVGGDAGVTYEPGWVASDDGNVAPTNANLTGRDPFATWTPSAGSQENLPINLVNWYEAFAFCIWDGGFLPSDTEREYAAAGGSQQRLYPWGSTDPGTSNQYAIYGCYYPSGSTSCTGVENIAPVGTATLGAGLWGQLDLAGMFWEWTLDWYASSYFDPCTNCADLTAASPNYRTLRGGLLGGATSSLLPPNGNANPPSTRSSDFGFRCARTP